MKNNNNEHKAKGEVVVVVEEEEEEEEEQRKRLEIVKAAAQAWLNHSNATKKAANSESEAQRRRGFVKDKPSRFKVEASPKAYDDDDINPSSGWDFGQSLWDSYEIVAVSKKLERGLALGNAFSGLFGHDDEDLSRLRGLEEKEKKEKKKREDRVSLKSLFYSACSRRYNDVDV